MDDESKKRVVEVDVDTNEAGFLLGFHSSKMAVAMAS